MPNSVSFCVLGAYPFALSAPNLGRIAKLFLKLLSGGFCYGVCSAISVKDMRHTGPKNPMAPMTNRIILTVQLWLGRIVCME